jgi:phosphoglycerol transferase MdoB-like AlkP superfamily enzyme
VGQRYTAVKTSPSTKPDYDEDTPQQPIASSPWRPRRQTLGLFANTALRRLLRLVLHAALVVVAIVPFATDVLLLRIRGMRFTFEFVSMYLREINFTSDFAVDPREVTLAWRTVEVSGAVAVLLIVVSLTWLEFTQWHVACLFTKCFSVLTPPSHYGRKPSRWWFVESATTSRVDLEKGGRPSVLTAKRKGSIVWRRAVLVVALPLVLWASLCSVLMLITHAVPAVVSAAALNNSLNELFRTTTKLQFLKSLGDGSIASAHDYVDAFTETYTLFQDDVLYRKTTGFQGPLAFDVQVNTSDPPNVIVLVVESFRYQDSLYIVGNRSQPLLQRQGNVTLTPQFDKWAQRGVAFRNMWSSWQTSRSLESILYGQVPYDHITDTGTSGGRKDVPLVGMPQLFKQKGYETVFTTGAPIDYDQWDKFLPSHGFDEVLHDDHFQKLAEETLGIKPNDWLEQKRNFSWGVHDDIALPLLGDLLIERTRAQADRVKRGDGKKPFFLNHYTISSHAPFRAAPSWFAEMDLPQLSPAYQGRDNEYDTMEYARMRYFTDLALGKFLDRMKAAGVLDDTIVVVVGDHGQSPEQGLWAADDDQVATTRVAAALIAEGRLGNYTGLVLDDATEHVDLLNTLADIVGVPDGGFLQTGVGRSLKRAVPFGSHAVYTNNPKKTLAVVKGHHRLRFDRVFSMMQLFDVENDPDETRDLLPALTGVEQSEWETLRERARRVSRYFKVRWDQKCIAQVEC